MHASSEQTSEYIPNTMSFGKKKHFRRKSGNTKLRDGKKIKSSAHAFNNSKWDLVYHMSTSP